jgi:hypothetical protein
MSFANPLTYTRGTPIHIHIRFADGNLADASSLRIVLVNTIRTVNEGSSRLQKRAASPTHSVMRNCISSAICYTRPQDESLGVVHGEIRVPKDLTPDFEFKGVRSEVGDFFRFFRIHRALSRIFSGSIKYFSSRVPSHPQP